MRPIITDQVGWSVCRSVTLMNEPCKNGWTDQDAIWVEDSVGPRNHVLDGVHVPHGNGQF